MKGDEKRIRVSKRNSRVVSIGHKKEMRFNWERFLILGVLIISILGIWMFFFSYASCDTWECFNAHLKDCSKVKFIGGTDMVFEYIIKGSSNGECEVAVQLLQGKFNNQDSIKLEMQKMTCSLPKGVVMIPESDIGNCHGMLKEGLQDLVIKKLYTYLVQNLGKLNLEMLDVPEVN